MDISRTQSLEATRHSTRQETTSFMDPNFHFHFKKSCSFTLF
jgi:hypothetical protein